MDNLSENVKRGNRQKLRNGGWPHTAPIGYLNEAASRTIIVDPNYGHLITKLFETYSKGKFLNNKVAIEERLTKIQKQGNLWLEPQKIWRKNGILPPGSARTFVCQAEP